MNAPRIQTVLIDYGGVIAEEGFLAGLETIAARNGKDPEAFFHTVVDVIFASGYINGRATEAEFWRLVRSAAELDPERESDQLMRDEILRRFKLRPWMLDLVDKLRESGRVVAILSDQVNWLDELETRDRFFHHFDRVFNSYHEGMNKRQEAFFRHALERLGAASESALFIDDARRNVAVARGLGIHAIHFEFDDLNEFWPLFHAVIPDIAATM